MLNQRQNVKKQRAETHFKVAAAFKTQNQGFILKSAVKRRHLQSAHVLT